ncbi:MAG: hypothetical protein ACE5NG_19750, partial [bacterium]
MRDDEKPQEGGKQVMAGVKVKIADLVVDKSFHERFTLNDDAINRYIEMYQQGKHKAIKIQKSTNKIIDGIHRYEAAKKAGVTETFAVILDVPDTALRMLAYQGNKGHGVPFSKAERDKLIENLYLQDGKTQQQIVDIVGLDQSFISRILSGICEMHNTDNTDVDCVSENEDTDNKTTKKKSGDKRRKLSKSDIPNIIRLHLGGEIQENIAKTYNVGQSTIAERISKKKDEILKDYTSGKLKKEVAEKHSFTPSEIDEILQMYGDPINFEPLYTTFWPGFGIDKRFGQKHPGNLPAQLVRNLLYFYSKSGDHILDPMAGGGVVIDVVNDMVNRTVEAFDLSPVREDIQRHDLLTGEPPVEKEPDVIILDPPYGSQKECEYNQVKSDLSTLSVDEFIEAIATILGYWKHGTIILFMSPMQKDGQYFDLPCMCHQKLIDNGWRVKKRLINQMQRASSINRIWLEQARKSRFVLQEHVDIIVAEKGE